MSGLREKSNVQSTNHTLGTMSWAINFAAHDTIASFSFMYSEARCCSVTSSSLSSTSMTSCVRPLPVLDKVLNLKCKRFHFRRSISYFTVNMPSPHTLDLNKEAKMMRTTHQVQRDGIHRASRTFSATFLGDRNLSLEALCQSVWLHWTSSMCLIVWHKSATNATI